MWGKEKQKSVYTWKIRQENKVITSQKRKMDLCQGLFIAKP